MSTDITGLNQQRDNAIAQARYTPDELARAAWALHPDGASKSFDDLLADVRSGYVEHARAILAEGAPATPFDHLCVTALNAPEPAPDPEVERRRANRREAEALAEQAWKSLPRPAWARAVPFTPLSNAPPVEREELIQAAEEVLAGKPPSSAWERECARLAGLDAKPEPITVPSAKSAPVVDTAPLAKPAKAKAVSEPASKTPAKKK